MNVATIPRVVFGRVTIATGVNDVLIFYDGTSNRTATVAAGDYYVRGDSVSTSGQKDLLSALATALNTAPSSGITDFTVTVDHAVGSGQGKVTIASAGLSTFQLLWTNASTTFDAAGSAQLGFDTSADDTGAATYTSDNPSPVIWYPGYEAEYQANLPTKDVVASESIGGVWDVQTIRATQTGGLVKIVPVTADKVNTDDVSGATVCFQDFWEDASAGGPFLYYPLYTSDSNVVHRIVKDLDWMADMAKAAPILEGFAGTVYGVSIPMSQYTSAT